ncbi:nuclear transport factor 2 family protein [Streptomyces sp. ADI98-10]|uniref:nuclear transport factor 2 family protein n=1 Tax=Streptomyces sp. ADI98-10 TaxID=1522763 RepID=UPI000F5578B9|nr:nuclear transport factor 2 family protein [Streptomyces sp. ADI98-10]RPK87699.1 Calcium/calmodulin dependent protein kinase II Association [Streptomyces sp. ADI98-10]
MEDSGAGSGPPPNGAEDGQDPVPQARLAALVEEWSAAIVSNDVTRIGAFMADEWVIVSESGITDRATFLGYVESGDLTHSAMRAISTPRVRVHGDSATTTARITNTAHYDGRRFDADEWVTDVFLRRDGRWLCVLTHITPAAQPDDASAA